MINNSDEPIRFSVGDVPELPELPPVQEQSPEPPRKPAPPPDDWKPFGWEW